MRLGAHELTTFFRLQDFGPPVGALDIVCLDLYAVAT